MDEKTYEISLAVVTTSKKAEALLDLFIAIAAEIGLCSGSMTEVEDGEEEPKPVSKGA